MFCLKTKEQTSHKSDVSSRTLLRMFSLIISTLSVEEKEVYKKKETSENKMKKDDY